MESETFRIWLMERGCRIDSHRLTGRSRGHPVVMVHREQRKAELPLPGRGQQIHSDIVRRICADLELDPAELPGPRSRV